MARPASERPYSSVPRFRLCSASPSCRCAEQPRCPPPRAALKGPASGCARGCNSRPIAPQISVHASPGPTTRPASEHAGQSGEQRGPLSGTWPTHPPNGSRLVAVFAVPQHRSKEDVAEPGAQTSWARRSWPFFGIAIDDLPLTSSNLGLSWGCGVEGSGRVILDFGGRVVFGHDGGPAGAAGLRLSGFLACGERTDLS